MTYEFADRLIELRKDNGMSQEELAQRIGLSRQAVSKWERAESSPDIGNLVALAEIYGLTIDDIVKGTSAVSSEPGEEASCEEAAEVEAATVEEATAAGEAAAVEEAIGVEAAADEIADDEPEANAYAEANAAADGAGAQPRQPEDDVSKMPPPDPSQRVDWAPPASEVPPVSGSASTQAPPPGHIYGGPQGAPDAVAQPFASPDPMAQSAGKPRKPAALMFPYPVLCVLLYLILGFAFGLWHPCWIIFLTIPFYYWIVNVVVADPLWRARHGYLDE